MSNTKGVTSICIECEICGHVNYYEGEQCEHALAKTKAAKEQYDKAMNYFMFRDSKGE